MIVLNDVLKGKHSVAIGGHIRPDGDCVGSTIGLYLYLTTYYPEIETDLYLEEIPEAFQMMGHRDVPKHEIVEGKVYDLFISLDCGDERRLGFSEPVFQKAKETLCVDHHISNESLQTRIISCRMQVLLRNLFSVCWMRRRLRKKSHLSFIWGLCMIPECSSIPVLHRRQWKSVLHF